MKQTFYATSYEDENGYEYVNVLTINFENKTYKTFNNVFFDQLGGEDEFGEPIYETFVEVPIFEILLAGLKVNGYVKQE